jgi:tetratricopeptide (TPR) repeat protein
MIHTERKEFDKAISDYSKVLVYNPDNLMVYFNRGNIYMQNKQYKNAARDYSEAIKIYPDFIDAYANRAIARSQLNQKELATEDFDKARQLKEEHYAKTHEELVAEEEKIESLIEFEAEFFQSEKEKEQLQNREIDIDLLPDFSIIWNIDNDPPEYYDLKLLQLASKRNMKMEARISSNEISENDARNKIDSLNEVLQQFPASIQARYLRAVLNTEIKNYYAAISDYDQIIAIDSSFAPSYLNKGVIQSKLSLMYNAFNSSQSASFMLKDQPEFRSDENDGESIINNFKKAQELIPDLPYAYYNLANSYCKQLRYTEAFEYYNKAIEINPQLGEAYYNKGITMIYLGDNDNGCYYIGKSGELGIEEAYSVLKRYCNK